MSKRAERIGVALSLRTERAESRLRFYCVAELIDRVMGLAKGILATPVTLKVHSLRAWRVKSKVRKQHIGV